MKRRLVIFLVIIALFASMPICALASSSRILVIAPGLTYEGSTAKCTLAVTGDYTTDKIEAVIQLWYGSTCLKTWTKSGMGYLTFNDTYKVSANREYTLTADVKFNGISNPRVSITKKCE